MRSSLPSTAARPVRGRPAPRVPYDATMPVALTVHLLVVGAVVGSMVRFEATDRLQVLLPLGIAGLLVGYALALTRLPDLMSHVVTVWLGTVSSLTAVSLSVSSPAEIVASRGRVVWDLAGSVVTSVVRSDGSKLGDPQLLALLGMTTWMLAYTSSWVLYRRGWLAAALSPAAVVIAVSMRYEQDRPAWPVVMFLFAAVMLFARNQILERQRRWSQRGLRSPDVVGLRALALALPVAVVVLVAGHELPLAAPQEAVEPVAGALSSSWDAVRDEFVERLGLQGEGAGNYAEFPERFDIGGRLELGDAIVATLDSVDPHYLALRRYDFYDGAGWSSHVDETFRLDGDGASTKVTNVIFARSQSVALSGAVTEEREQVAGVVTVVQPKDDLVFTIETFSGASEAVVTVLGWERIEHRELDVADVDVASLPVDLQGLLRDLQDAVISPDPNGGEPRFVDRTVGDRVARERQRLAAYPVETELSLHPDGTLGVAVAGRVPNYDDIEAVFVDDRMVAGDQYRVLGQRSLADADALSAASTDYPGWVTSRYLETPDAVTERTRALAGTVVADAGAETPFDRARAIQEYLRANFRYDINPPVPEDGEDVVDFFLFESLVGRCEQYASAMVIMMRSLGVPARLVSGYRQSDEVNDVGQYVFREEQAHTWVEVFFPGYGWIPFEPTAGQDGFDYTGTDGPSPSAEAEQLPDPATPTPPSTVDVTPTPTAEASPTPPVSPALVRPDDGDRGTPWPLLGGLTAVALAAAGSWLALCRRSARGLTPVAAVYLGLIRLGSRVGVRAPPSATPAEYGAALTRALPRAGQSISTIVDAYHWDQFGPPGEGPARLARAREAWRSIRRPGWRERIGRR